MAKEDYKGIWIFAEQQNGVLNSVTLELLAKAQELKAHNGEDIYAILLGSDVKALAPTLIAHGADKVIVAEDAALASYSARPYQQAMTQLAEKYKPSIILYGATSLARDGLSQDRPYRRRYRPRLRRGQRVLSDHACLRRQHSCSHCYSRVPSPDGNRSSEDVRSPRG